MQDFSSTWVFLPKGTNRTNPRKSLSEQRLIGHLGKNTQVVDNTIKMFVLGKMKNLTGLMCQGFQRFDK
jgi:hypothetical protein